MYDVDTAKPGAQDYSDSLLALYASWGVDYITADDMISPYHAGEIEALSRAIRKCGRPMVLSLSPGPANVARAHHLEAGLLQLGAKGRLRRTEFPSARNLLL